MTIFKPEIGTRALSVAWCSAIFLVISVMASPAWCQEPPSGPLEYITNKPRLIRAQTELGGRLAEQALETLDAATEVEELEKARDLAVQSYKMLRFAWHGVQMVMTDTTKMSGQSLVLKMALDTILEARLRNLDAAREIAESIPPATREEHVAAAREKLATVPELTRRAAVLIPMTGASR